MNTHNIYFQAKIRKIICGYPLLSGVMNLLSPIKNAADSILKSFYRENNA